MQIHIGRGSVPRGLGDSAMSKDVSDEVSAIIAKHWKPAFVSSGKAINWRTIPSELLEGTE